MIIMATEYSAEWVKVPDGNGGTKKVWLRDSKARRDLETEKTKITTLQSDVNTLESYHYGGTLSNGTNLDNVKTIGVYMLSSNNTYTNAPSTYGLMEVFRSSTTANAVVQRITTVDAVFFRFFATTWRGWRKITSSAV